MGKCEGVSNYSIPRTLANIPPEPPATAILTMVIFESVFSTFGVGEINRLWMKGDLMNVCRAEY